jgi:broad specificity phosphatase PhoE
LTREQIERADAAVLQRFVAGDLDVRPGGGENLRELAQRAHSAVAEVVGAHPGRRLAIVTHLGVIRALSSGLGVGNACWQRLASAEIVGRVHGEGTKSRRSPG